MSPQNLTERNFKMVNHNIIMKTTPLYFQININLNNIEIDSLKDLKNGMYIHQKEVGSDFHIDVMIEKNMIGIDSEEIKERVPETLVFLIIIDNTYPEGHPKVLTKSNFCSPSLMDGRDLLNDICPNWTAKEGLKAIIEGMSKFLSKCINTKGYKFYGKFHLGATYDLKNFSNMIVSKLKILFYIKYVNIFFIFCFLISYFGLHC